MKTKLIIVLATVITNLTFATRAQEFGSVAFEVDFSGSDSVTNSVSVPAGETWEVANLYGISADARIQVVLGGKTVTKVAYTTNATTEEKWQYPVGLSSADFGFFDPSLNFPAPLVVGPAAIEVVSRKSFNQSQDSPSPHSVLVYRIYREQMESTPSNSVVIPTDATGPVEIILESSKDLVTWTPALPGEYGASTEKRFFRVRAVAK